MFLTMIWFIFELSRRLLRVEGGNSLRKNSNEWNLRAGWRQRHRSAFMNEFFSCVPIPSQNGPVADASELSQFPAIPNYSHQMVSWRKKVQLKMNKHGIIYGDWRCDVLCGRDVSSGGDGNVPVSCRIIVINTDHKSAVHSNVYSFIILRFYSIYPPACLSAGESPVWSGLVSPFGLIHSITSIFIPN